MTSIGKLSERVCEFDWRISNFFLLSLEDEEHYISPQFSFAGASWCVVIYPNGLRLNATIGYIGLYLWKKSDSPCPPVHVEYCLGLKALDGVKYAEQQRKSVFNDDDTPEGVDRCLARFKLEEKKSELLHDGVLTVFCTIKDLKPAEDTSGTEAAKCSHCKDTLNPKDLPSHEKKCINKPIKCPECSEVIALKNWCEHECQMTKEKGQNTSGFDKLRQKNKILQDLRQLFRSQEDTDVIFRLKGKEFPAHRVILKARSSVLASTFRNEMKEKATGIVDIEDFNPSIFSDFLCFLYCEDVETLSQENVFSLFTAADKYDVPDLRTMCIDFMKANLSSDTFCETITLALQHSEAEVISLTTDFFVKNADKIIVSVKWQTFAAENPTQSNELFIKFVESVKCSNS